MVNLKFKNTHRDKKDIWIHWESINVLSVKFRSSFMFAETFFDVDEISEGFTYFGA